MTPFSPISNYGHVLTDFLGKAIRYMPSSGSVTFSMAVEGSNMEVRVSDTGMRIEEKAMDRIFEEFYPSKAARASVPDSTGPGMVIVKAVVDRHQGGIRAESEVGLSTRVKGRLPLSPRG
jgi:two-component system phosphate regulon sensor histidine kinase PhoR